MKLTKINPTTTKAWQKLQHHFDKDIQKTTLQTLFKQEVHRVENFHIKWNDFLIDYSKNKITKKTITLLLELANEIKLEETINAYFSGEKINETENRAVLHTALRAKKNDVIYNNGNNIVPEIYEVKEKIKTFTNAVCNGNLKGYTNKSFTDVVNIGIGGSDLGPAMVTEALQYYKNHLNLHFVSNIDGDYLQDIFKKINPETTLFVIVSKTFTTQETITNATTIKKWFLQSAQPKDIAQHFVAVSTNSKKVTEFGISENNIFPMWNWVGGRFSLWSAVGLSISLAIGFHNFNQLLSGANEMDEHFKTTPLHQNIPVIVTLISIWYANFFKAETEAIIPYSEYLTKLVPYLQQGIMESNGKNKDKNGTTVNYQTGTIIWGATGTNAQHAFFQLLHQGTKFIPADFIGFKKSLYNNKEHHNKLMANFFAQTEALLMGKTEKQAFEELKKQGLSDNEATILAPFKTFKGDNPTTTILIEKLTPKNLGSLLALYEHKILVQGTIWNIFSYDQWGVELGKQLAGAILSEIELKKQPQHDSSTNFLIKNFLN